MAAPVRRSPRIQALLEAQRTEAEAAQLAMQVQGNQGNGEEAAEKGTTDTTQASSQTNLSALTDEVRCLPSRWNK